MTGNDLLRALNDIGDDLILEADKSRGASGPAGSGRVVRIDGGRTTRMGTLRRLSAGLIGAAAAVAVILLSVSLIRNRGVAVTPSAVKNAAVAEEDGSIRLAAMPDEPAEADAAGNGEEAAVTGGFEEETADAGAFGEDMTTGGYAAEETADLAQAGQPSAANPFREYESMTECETSTGFALEAPEAFADSVSRVIRSDGSGLVEVIYESELGDELLRIRKGTAEDVSGDYNTYAYEDDSLKAGDGCCFHVSGDAEDCLQLVTWSRDGFSYSANAGVYLLSGDDALSLVESVR